MSRHVIWLAAALLLAGRSLFAAAPSTAATAPAATPARVLKGYEKYQFFGSRNIFDPDRKPPPRQVATTQTPGVAGPRRPSPVTLVGTMEDRGRALAFFASPQPDLNKVIALKQTIAGFTITNIAAGTVEAEREGRKTLLSVGSSLPIEGAVAPVPGDAPPGSAEPAASPPSTTTPAAGAAPAAPATDPAEMARIMMERRRKEE